MPLKTVIVQIIIEKTHTLGKFPCHIKNDFQGLDCTIKAFRPKGGNIPIRKVSAPYQRKLAMS